MIFSKILVIYPQENLTKVAVYKNVNLVFLKIIRHGKQELSGFDPVTTQDEYRTNLILDELKKNEIGLDEIRMIIARGGLTKPVPSGVYEVNEAMQQDLRKGIMGMHAVNLGGLIAARLAVLSGSAKAYIADPAVVDELDEVARMTGHPLFQRKSVFHAINHKYIARKFARSINSNYEDLKLIVAHMGGGGLSVAAHSNGKVIDVNQAFDGDGPFALTRSGTLPAGDLVKICFSGKYSEKQIMKMITSEGGMMAYLNTDSVDELDKRISENDEQAKFVAFAMAYQTAKEIGGMCTVLNGHPDAIILSGEIFHCSYFTDHLTARIEKIAPISVFPTVNDMDALASNAVMVLNGELTPAIYG